VMEAVMTGNPPLSSVLPWVTTYLFITDSSNDKQLSSSFPTSTMFVYQKIMCLFVIRKIDSRN
jgi:hypothetical protein